MNILQVQDALKNASDNQLAGELQNPTGMAPSYLVLSELKRRQQMRQGAQSAQAPQGSMAEEAASDAEPEYYPEEQQQEEAPGIEAFREGGVVRMADGGIASGSRPIEQLNRDEVLAYLESLRFGPGPGGIRSPYSREDLNNRLQSLTAASRVDRGLANRPFLGSEENLPGSLASPPPSMPPSATPQANPQNQPVAPTEGQVPPVTVTAPAPSSPTRAGAGIGSVAPQAAPQQAPQEGISSLYDRLRELSPSREEYRSDATNNALMQAGLAMMASKDPNALANLGAGGLRGLQTYTDEMKSGRAQQRQAIVDEITARRANTEELYRRGLISNQERMIRLQEARMGQAAGERAEAREQNRELRLEQINQRNVAALGSSLNSIASEINRLQTELSNMTINDNRRGELTNRLTELQDEGRRIRRRLSEVAGMETETPAPRQNLNMPPPGAPIIPYRVPGNP